MNPNGRPPAAPETRFWPRVRKVASGCWEWQGARLAAGYGVFWDGHNNVKAHRWSFEFHIGPIAPGMTIDHLCLNPRCVNPAHLDVVTRAENNRRRHALRTACPQGHPYDGRSGAQRICTRCRNESKRRSYAKKRAA